MPEGYFGQYVTIGVFALVGTLLVFGTLQLSRLVRPSVPHPEKLTTYESGIDPIGQGWSQANVRYYIFALLFVVFDVEAVFLFPWAVAFDRLGLYGLLEMVAFIGLLLFGYVYAWRKGGLEWV